MNVKSQSEYTLEYIVYIAIACGYVATILKLNLNLIFQDLHLEHHVADCLAGGLHPGAALRRQQRERGRGGAGGAEQLRPQEHPQLLLQVPRIL